MAGKIISWPEIGHELTAVSTVSAFAARKAVRRPIGHVSSQNQVQTSLVDEIYNDPLEKSKPIKKKQKRGNKSRTKSARQPQQIDGLLDAWTGSIDDGEKDLESDSESYLASDDGSEALAQPNAPLQGLSTFDLSRSTVLSETETEWTVRLHANDVRIHPISYCMLQGLKST